VPALVPVRAGSACPRGRDGLTGAPAGLWVLLVPLVAWVLLWVLVPLVLVLLTLVGKLAKRCKSCTV